MGIKETRYLVNISFLDDIEIYSSNRCQQHLRSAFYIDDNLLPPLLVIVSVIWLRFQEMTLNYNKLNLKNSRNNINHIS